MSGSFQRFLTFIPSTFCDIFPIDADNNTNAPDINMVVISLSALIGVTKFNNFETMTIVPAIIINPKLTIAKLLISDLTFATFSNAKAIRGNDKLKAITDLKSTVPISLNARPIAKTPPAINSIKLTPSLIPL